MRTLLFIVLFIAILMTPSAAENVTIEVFETSDIYYISLDGGELIACPDDECTLDITNYTTNTTTTELDLSRNDMKKIAQYVSIEMGVNGIGSGDLNKTYYDSTQIIKRNEVIDGILPVIRNTLMPEVDNVTALKANLTASHIIISDLKSDIKVLEGKIEGHDKEVELLEDELFNTKIGIAGIAFLFGMSLILQGNRIQRGINFLKNVRK